MEESLVTLTDCTIRGNKGPGESQPNPTVLHTVTFLTSQQHLRQDFIQHVPGMVYHRPCIEDC